VASPLPIRRPTAPRQCCWKFAGPSTPSTKVDYSGFVIANVPGKIKIAQVNGDTLMLVGHALSQCRGLLHAATTQRNLTIPILDSEVLVKI
jgi:hypothetical protein